MFECYVVKKHFPKNPRIKTGKGVNIFCNLGELNAQKPIQRW